MSAFEFRAKDRRGENYFEASSLFVDCGGTVSLADDRTEFRVSAPFHSSRGTHSWHEGVRAPIASALVDATFTTAMQLESQRDGGRRQLALWGTLEGTFVAPLCGLGPNYETVHLRVGLVADIVNDWLERCTVMVDLLDLAAQSGQLFTAPPLGASGAWPHPRAEPSAGDSVETLAVVRAMQSDLHDDARTREQMLTALHLRHWTSDFVWAGPGGIGLTSTSKGFVDHHQYPFRRAFPDRVGGGALPPGDHTGSTGHFVKFAQGAWAVTGGWPSIVATHSGDGWLGLPASGKSVTLRVFDFYEVTNRKISMNWVFIDIVDFLSRLGTLPKYIRGYPVK